MSLRGREMQYGVDKNMRKSAKEMQLVCSQRRSVRARCV